MIEPNEIILESVQSIKVEDENDVQAIIAYYGFEILSFLAEQMGDDEIFDLQATYYIISIMDESYI